jgi:hypothetical protein
VSEIPHPIQKPTASTSESDFRERCAILRPEVAVPGYWDSLAENCQQWADEISICPLWKAVAKHQPAWSNEFSQLTTGSLLASPLIPQFTSKSVRRMKSKSIELFLQKGNVFEILPKVGAPVPNLNDLVRTRVECQFLDGVEFFVDRIEKLAAQYQIKCARHREGRLEGYFAQHFYFEQQVFFRFGGDCQPTTIKCELQVATALATRIWEESHKVYEQWRGRRDQRDEWQWDPTDPRFVARQLGHMIHLADGLLVQLRDATAK